MVCHDLVRLIVCVDSVLPVVLIEEILRRLNDVLVQIIGQVAVTHRFAELVLRLDDWGLDSLDATL